MLFGPRPPLNSTHRPGGLVEDVPDARAATARAATGEEWDEDEEEEEGMW